MTKVFTLLLDLPQGPAGEIARVLTALAGAMPARPASYGTICDENGAKIGSWHITGDEEAVCH
jgi:hypothetical protein